MKLGIQMGRLAQRRRRLLISALIGLVAAAGSIDHVSLLPPHLSSRDVEIASADTTVIVDTAKSVIVDTSEGNAAFNSLEDRAILLGNVIGSEPVLQYMAQRLHVPVQAIAVSAPGTPNESQPPVIVGGSRRVTDILRYADQYRISTDANPAAPVLDVYTEAPTVNAAKELANAAVSGLQHYMTSLDVARNVPASSQLRLTQLGAAQGGITNPGAPLQLALIAFAVGFAVALGAISFIGRFRQGWKLATASS